MGSKYIKTLGESRDTSLLDETSSFAEKKSIFNLESLKNEKIVSVSYDSTKKIWDLTTGEFLLTLSEDHISRHVAVIENDTIVSVSESYIYFSKLYNEYQKTKDDIEIFLIIVFILSIVISFTLINCRIFLLIFNPINIISTELDFNEIHIKPN